MEGDAFGLDFSILNIDLVSDQNHWDVFTNTDQITMPVRYILVSDTSGYIKHNYGTMSLNIVSVAKTAEFFLAGSVPNVKADFSSSCMENKRVNFHPKSG